MIARRPASVARRPASVARGPAWPASETRRARLDAPGPAVGAHRCGSWVPSGVKPHQQPLMIAASRTLVSYWSPARTEVMRCVLKPSQCIRPT